MLEKSRFAARSLPLIAVLACACEPTLGRAFPGNLLHGKRPIGVTRVDHAERATDANVPSDGDNWLTDLSAVFHGQGAELVYDLGHSSPIDAVFLEADNNDRFTLSVSDDGKRYTEIWRAQAVDGAGMRSRSVRGFAQTGRYLKLTALGGDSYISVGELMVFAAVPDPWPPSLYQHPGLNPFDEARTTAVLFAVLLAVLLALCHRRLPRWAPLLAGVCALGLGIDYARSVIEQWPPDIGLGEQLRALLAGVGALAILLSAVLGARLRLRALNAILLVLGLLGLACFYNFGAPWFWNAEKDRLTPVHTYDMRVYYPVAKYFNELRFDGVYLASVQAYLEGQDLPDRAVNNVELRDLHTNEIVRANAVMPEIHAVKQRFSPERWQSFKRDMSFFWRTMGSAHYLGSLEDHGGNATPVWLAIANLLFRYTEASERTLSLTALLDPLLLLMTFVCIARSFGLRAMSICLLVFGTCDFPMFGSDWIGATLRFDWMATLGLGACALRTRRYALGGALLAHAGLARAFPAVALLFTPAPFVLHLIERLWRKRRVEASELRREHAGIGRLWLSAAATTLVLVALSCALFGAGPAWGGWFQKIALHTEQPNSNHIGIRTLMAFDPRSTTGALTAAHASDVWREWERTQLETYESRKVLTWALRALFTLLCLLACRGARPEQAAVLGLILIPVFTYPANYYCHYVYLLPLLAVDQPPWLARFIEFVLVLSSVFEFFALGYVIDVRFFYEALILLTSYLVILIPLAAHALGFLPRFARTAPAARAT